MGINFVNQTKVKLWATLSFLVLFFLILPWKKEDGPTSPWVAFDLDRLGVALYLGSLEI